MWLKYTLLTTSACALYPVTWGVSLKRTCLFKMLKQCTRQALSMPPGSPRLPFPHVHPGPPPAGADLKAGLKSSHHSVADVRWRRHTPACQPLRGDDSESCFLELNRDWATCSNTSLYWFSSILHIPVPLMLSRITSLITYLCLNLYHRICFRGTQPTKSTNTEATWHRQGKADPWGHLDSDVVNIHSK